MVGVIYLSRPEDCAGQGAIGFYRHRQTQATWSSPAFAHLVIDPLADLHPEEARRRYLEHMKDPHNWDEIERVGMRYNRAVVLFAQCFHGSLGVFGTQPENGRLTQHFEFYLPEQAS